MFDSSTSTSLLQGIGIRKYTLCIYIIYNQITVYGVIADKSVGYHNFLSSTVQLSIRHQPKNCGEN
jgi:hypothetical protein